MEYIEKSVKPTCSINPQKRKIKKIMTARNRCGTINASLEARTSKDKVVL